MKPLFISTLILLSHAASAAPEPDRVIEYKVVGGTKLKLHVFTPEDRSTADARPAIVFFFGGGWNGGRVSQFYPQSEHLAEQGMVAICAEYRVKSRDRATPRDCVADGKSALRWVRTHAEELVIDPERIAAGGGSAGGHIAAAIAAADGFDEPGEDTSVSCRPDALVLFNPVIDNGPGGYGHDRVSEYWRAFSPLHNIDSQTPPTLVLLGTNDHLIPVKTAKEYKRRMEAVGVRCDLKLYEDQRHGFFNQGKKDSNYYDKTVRDMDAFLGSLGFISRDTESTTTENADSDTRIK